MILRRIFSDLYRYFFPLSIIEMYRRMGVKIGEGSQIQFGVIIDYSHYWHIEIGKNVTIAPHVHILAHDASTKRQLGYTFIGKVIIQDNCFIGAQSLILPGVIIGQDSIIAAGSVVNRDIPKNSLVAGVPAKVIGTTMDFYHKHERQMATYPLFDKTYTLSGKITEEKKEEMNNKMKLKFGYIR